MSNQITGVISHIGPVQNIGEKFKKREVWLEFKDGKFDQTVCVEFQMDRVDMPDNYAEGELVTVSYDLRGKVWNGGNEPRVFNTLVAWKIERTAPEQPVQPRPKSVQPHTPAPVAPGDEMPGADDDLPF